jgi:hypothetical protein
MQVSYRFRKASRAVIVTAVTFMITLLLAPAARADSSWHGYWQGRSIVYVYWGDGCDNNKRDVPHTSMNINFGGGVRPDGTTYIYDFYIANGSAHELHFPNGFNLYEGGVERVFWIERIPGRGGSVRKIVDTVFPSTVVTGHFYPVADATHCNLTSVQVRPTPP